jgi:hypothetical protein
MRMGAAGEQCHIGFNAVINGTREWMLGCQPKLGYEYLSPGSGSNVSRETPMRAC